MQFMMILTETQDDWNRRNNPATAGEYWGGWNAFLTAMAKSGIVVSGDGLQSPTTATTVRVRNGKRVVQDGPFADSKEQLGGYFIIEVASLDEALEWAAKAPSAHTAAVEIRPVMVMNAPKP